MKTDELREKYLSFFETKGHSRQPSDVLVPTWDPSVLFTPAGMNPFKDHFLGKVKLEFTRATTCQKCLRTGDIDNVGRTAFHHTFFEMLGNFSFGDYFKRDAIHWAWEFLTDKKWLGIDPDRLTVTVYQDDSEAADIWSQDIGLPGARITPMDEHDNFWPAGAPSLGPDGVCGPCSEIFYVLDDGSDVEIWNLVFTQFNRVGDPPDNLRPLPSKNIDTGMGLERAASVLQGETTNYHIDTLRPIVEAAAEVCSREYDPSHDDGRRLRRITDHVRACTFAVHENVYPGAQKEKYVIRRLLRRAVLDGHQMGLRDPFLHQLVSKVVEICGKVYPELKETQERVASVIEKEEANFFGTLDQGLQRIDQVFSGMKEKKQTTVNGDEAADLYQTNGVPPELLETLASEQGLAFDWPGFREAMKKHGLVSGGDDIMVMGDAGPVDSIKRAVKSSEFLGYESTEAEVEVKGLIDIRSNLLEDRLDVDDAPAPVLRENHPAPPKNDLDPSAIVVLDKSPFYSESGGQVGDTGWIEGPDGKFEVTDTQRSGEVILHYGHLRQGSLKTTQTVSARVDSERRQAIRRAHSATHILHYALQKNLGSHAQQQGSKVEADALRFDFTNLSQVSQEQLTEISADVQDRIDAGEPIQADILPLADARKAGAMMLFGEKYPDPVRMVSMGEFSKELCGGIHLENTGQVGAWEIVSEENVSAGTRRISALTGDRAKQYAEQVTAAVKESAALMGVTPADVPNAVKRLIAHARDWKKHLSTGAEITTSAPSSRTAGGELDYPSSKANLLDAARTLNVPLFETPQRIASIQKEIEGLKKQAETLAQAGDLSAEGLLKQAAEIDGVHVVTAETPGANPNLMRQWIDQIRKQTEASAVLLAAVVGDSKVILVAGVSRDLVERGISAGKWVGEAAKPVGGGGGGKPDMAQAGGKQPENVPQALQTAKEQMEKWLAE